MSKTAPTPENPRMLLAAFLDRYLSRPGALGTFLERVTKTLGQGETSYRNFVWHVRAGRRAVPEGAEEVWARCLGILPETPEWREFLRLVLAARAYGKLDSREHLNRMEVERTAFEEENRNLKLRLAKAEEALAELESEIVRLRSDCDCE
jgi:hypothetical protein